MEPLSLAFEINQFSQDIYEKNAYSPYPDHPLLSHHAKTNLLLQEAQGRYFNGDIHANYKSEFEAKSIPILKTMQAPMGLIELMPSIVFEDDQSGSPKLKTTFIQSMKYYQHKHPQMDMKSIILFFFEHEAYLPVDAVAKQFKTLNDQYQVMHNQSIEATIDGHTEHDQEETAFNGLCKDVKMLSWQMTLKAVANFFNKETVSNLFDVDTLHRWLNAFHHNFDKAILECPNQTMVENIIEALIGDSDNINTHIKDIHPKLKYLWQQNLQADDSPVILRGRYETSQVGLSHFIHKITNLPVTLISKQLKKYDALKQVPTHTRLTNTDTSSEPRQYLDEYTHHFNSIKDNLQTFLLNDLGLCKAHIYLDQSHDNLRKLANFSKPDLGDWLKKQINAHLADFSQHYLTLVTNGPYDGHMYDGKLDYHWVTQFYWMLLSQCKSQPSRETNQLFYKMLTDCLVATDNHFKCFRGLYEDAMATTPMLHQAFNDTDHKQANQLSEYYAQIANHLFEDTVTLHVNGAINSDLFHWWQVRKTQSGTLSEHEYLRAKAINPHLFSQSIETEKRTLFNIRYTFVQDLCEHTCLNLDTCYAVADHLNLVYYCQKMDTEPSTIWELIQDNACYSDEDDLTRVNASLFKPIDTRLSDIPNLFNKVLRDCDDDMMPVITPNIQLNIFKKHDIDVLSFCKVLTEKRVKLMFAINPKIFAKIPLSEIKYEQYQYLAQWFNPIIPYLPYDLSMDAYWWLLQKLHAYRFRIYRVKDSMFENVEFKIDVFLNLILLDYPVNSKVNQNSTITYDYAPYIFASFDNLVTRLRMNNLDTCHEYIVSIIQSKWRHDPDWANLYFNWMTYYKKGTYEQKQSLLDYYLHNPTFSALLTCSEDIQIMKLLQMCPDRFIDIIDHFLDKLPTDIAPNYIEENHVLRWVVFYHHDSKPSINQSNYKIRWLYFMHRLKGRTDLDPIRQSVHDAMVISMNKEIKHLNKWASQFESIFHHSLSNHQYLQRWLYYIALDENNTFFISNRELKGNHNELLAPHNAFLKKWIPYANLKLEQVMFRSEVLQETIHALEHEYQNNNERMSDFERNHLLEQIHALTNLYTQTRCNIS